MDNAPLFPWYVGDLAWELSPNRRGALNVPLRIVSHNDPNWLFVMVTVDCDGETLTYGNRRDTLVPARVPVGARLRFGVGPTYSSIEPFVPMAKEWTGLATFGNTTVVSYPDRCMACGGWGHVDRDYQRCAKSPPARVKAEAAIVKATSSTVPRKVFDGDRATAKVRLCATCGGAEPWSGLANDFVHAKPCQPVRACGHRDVRLYRWYESGVGWSSGCNDCASEHAADEDP